MDIHVAGLNLSFAGGEAALRDVNVDIPHGQFASIVGPSSCGKTTLLRVIAGLIPFSDGVATVGGDEPAAARRAHGRLAYVFQEPTLIPWRTAQSNVRLPLELAGVRATEQRSSSRAALELLGLNERDLAKFPANMAGSMRMRVSLARALVTRPQLLLLDEPFAAADELLRDELNEQLSRLWQDQGWTALFVTHSIAEAVFLSQRIFVMTPRPGTIRDEFEVSFPFPRSADLRTDPAFAALVRRVSHALRGTQP